MRNNIHFTGNPQVMLFMVLQTPKQFCNLFLDELHSLTILTSPSPSPHLQVTSTLLEKSSLMWSNPSQTSSLWPLRGSTWRGGRKNTPKSLQCSKTKWRHPRNEIIWRSLHVNLPVSSIRLVWGSVDRIKVCQWASYAFPWNWWNISSCSICNWRSC